MEIAAPHLPEPPVPSTRKDPGGFVVLIVLALFAVTMMAVITTQLANEFNWQVM